MRIISTPARVDPKDIAAFLANGYKSVDETQVVRIETDKYFRFLLNMITAAGGTVEMGTHVTKSDFEKLKSSQNVVNCLGNMSAMFSISHKIFIPTVNPILNLRFWGPGIFSELGIRKLRV